MAEKLLEQEVDLTPPPPPSQVAEGEDVSLSPRELAEVGEVLDRLAREAASPAGEGEPPKPPVEDAPEPPPQPQPPSGALASRPEETPPKPAEASDKPSEPPAPDEFDAFKLVSPKPKSAEAFEGLKRAAREVRDALKRELAEVRAKLAAAEQELEALRARQDRLPEAVEKELDELRRFRAAHEVEYDPEVRGIQERFQRNEEAIYQRLLSAGVPADSVDKIKALGGPDQVDWEPILSKLPVPTARFIEAKLVERETLRDEKEQLLEKARTRADQYKRELAERRAGEVWGAVQQILDQVPLLKTQEVPPGATPEQRAKIEATNKEIAALLANLRSWVSDVSPARVAELAVGAALAHRFKSALDAVDPLVQQLRRQVEELSKERERLTQELGRLKAGERPAQRSLAPPPRPTSKPSLLSMDPGEALDLLAKEVVGGDRS